MHRTRIKRLAYEVVLATLILAVSGGLVFWGTHTVAAIKVTPEQRRQRVCSEGGGAMAIVAAEKMVRESTPLPDDAFFNRNDLRWTGDCTFEMLTRIKTFNGPRRFDAKIHFEPVQSDWFLDAIVWSDIK